MFYIEEMIDLLKKIRFLNRMGREKTFSEINEVILEFLTSNFCLTLGVEELNIYWKMVISELDRCSRSINYLRRGVN